MNMFLNYFATDKNLKNTPKIKKSIKKENLSKITYVLLRMSCLH